MSQLVIYSNGGQEEAYLLLRAAIRKCVGNIDNSVPNRYGMCRRVVVDSLLIIIPEGKIHVQKTTMYNM